QTSLAFDAAKFGDKTSKNVGAKQCLDIVPVDATSDNNPDICKTPLRSWPYMDPSFIFWTMKSDKDTIDSFVVLQRGLLLQTCSTRVNSCEFSLP
ncbi:MAG TPA: hypothetical protein VKQ72_14540, partial [Aggregatilineales bacterium]|nr:hypothetical protein [Aggregatilineales bacterium]